MAVGALWKMDKSKLRMKPMDTFLPPIEKPTGLMKKLIFAMTRRQVGKVLTPLKVFTARLPLRFGQFYAKVSQLDKKLLLSPETALLIRQQVARLNLCSHVGLLFRTCDLRDCLARCQRTPLQHDQYRSEHPFGRAL